MSDTLTPGPSPTYFASVGQRESGGNPNIGYHNLAVGTAAGEFGITDPTWNGLMKVHPELGLTSANRMDPDANRRAMAALTGDNTKFLSGKGLPVTDQSLGLLQFLGPTAGAAFLTADPNMSVQDALVASVGPQQAQQFIQSNPTILGGGKKVGDVLAQNNQSLRGANGSTAMSPVSVGPAGSGPFQSSPVPPMPADFGVNPSGPQPGGYSTPAQLNTVGHTGDGQIATGMAIMGGNGWHDAMAKGAAAMQASSAQAQQAAIANATLQNDADTRNFNAPQMAAKVAADRAAAWTAQNAPNRLTPDQAGQLNNQARQTDATMFDAQQRAAYMAALTKGAPQQYVLPGETPDKNTIIEGTKDAAGNFTFTNTSTGAKSSTLPPGAVTQEHYSQSVTNDYKTLGTNQKLVTGFMADGTAAMGKLNDLQRTQDDLGKPGVLSGPGLVANVGRTIDNIAGTSIFSNLSDQQTANLDLKGLNWASVRSATQGTGRLMANEINILSKNAPDISTDPVARQNFFGVLQNAAQRQADVANSWAGMDPVQKQAILKTPGGVTDWLYKQNQTIYQQQAQAQSDKAAASRAPAQADQGIPQAPQNRPPLASFGAQGGPPAVGMPQGPQVAPAGPQQSQQQQPYGILRGVQMPQDLGDVANQAGTVMNNLTTPAPGAPTQNAPGANYAAKFAQAVATMKAGILQNIPVEGRTPELLASVDEQARRAAAQQLGAPPQ